MSPVQVGNLVASIVAAFANGMDVFTRVRAEQAPKKGRRKLSTTWTQQDRQLHDSLQFRPRQIQAEYDKKLARLGGQFAVGDCRAQTALNHTLLFLNSGLIQILSHALSNDSRSQPMSIESLIQLSETAAADALRALDQLYTRLSTTRGKRSTLYPAPGQTPSKQAAENPKSSQPLRPKPGLKLHSKLCTSVERKRPGPNPVVRGAWVRSKSGPTVLPTSFLLSISSTPKVSQRKMTLAPSPPSPLDLGSVGKPSHHRRTKSSPVSAPRPDGTRSSRDPPENKMSYLDSSQPPPSASHEREEKTHHPNHQPSLLIVSPEVFNDTHRMDFLGHEFTQFPSTGEPFSSPNGKNPSPSIEVHPPPEGNKAAGLRPRPPSTTTLQTFATASTKIGEIPEHRRLDRANHIQPCPAATPTTLLLDDDDDEEDGNEHQPAPSATNWMKRKAWALKFWKRKDFVKVF